MALAYQAVEDPAVYTRLDTMKQWMGLWHHYPRYRPRMAAAWETAKAKLDKIAQGHRWVAVRGIVSATICTLLDLGWQPSKANTWEDATGGVWEATEAPPGGDCDLAEQVAIDAHAPFWRRMECHTSGLSRAPDLTVYRKHRRRLERRRDWRMRGLLDTVATAAVWPAQRRHHADNAISPMCPRCGKAEESELHRVWQCSHNYTQAKAAAREDNEEWLQALQSSEHLVAKATAGHESNGTLWLRGLPESFESQPDHADAVRRVGSEAQEDWPAGTYFTDGAATTSDQRVRRVGFGAAGLQRDSAGRWGLARGLVGHLGSERHTVPRAELRAVIALVEALAPGHSQVWTDAKYVAAGFGAGRHLTQQVQIRHARSNQDLWCRLGNAMTTRGVQLTVSWMKSHATDQHILSYNLSEQQVVGNYVADALAGVGASENPRPVVDVDTLDQATWLVQKRLLVTHSMALAFDEEHRSGGLPNSRAKKDGPISSSHDGGRACRLAAAVASGHAPDGTGVCSKCGLQLTDRRARWWKQHPCVADALAQVSAPSQQRVVAPHRRAGLHVGGRRLHGSHQLAAFRGLVWCWRCGSTATFMRVDGPVGCGRAGALADVCAEKCIGAGAEYSLKQLRQGLPPRTDRDWPLPADVWDSAFPIEIDEEEEADSDSRASSEEEVEAPPPEVGTLGDAAAAANFEDEEEFPFGLE